MQDLKYEIIDGSAKEKQILKGEIEGAETFYYSIDKGEKLTLEADRENARIFVISKGCVCVNNHKLKERGVAAFAPEDEIVFEAEKDSNIFEIRWYIKPDEKYDKSKLPYYLNYADAVKYKEECKSDKTISRYLLEQRILPGIAMGSVETYGYDMVKKHTHPYVDQLFFSFDENDMQVLIDDGKFDMKGNTLLHIPLASSHGVLAPENHKVHYVWIDFIIDEQKGLEFLDTAHQIIDEK